MDSIPLLRSCKYLPYIVSFLLYLEFDNLKNIPLGVYMSDPLHGRPDRVLNGALTAISLSAKDLHTRIVIMSGTGPRESIFPTRMALTNTKTRLKGAQTGHSLLAKKRDALTTRFRAILRKVDEVSHHSPPRIQEIACIKQN